MTKPELIESLNDLGFPLLLPQREKTSQQVNQVLIELSNSNDSRLLEGFPVILAHCAYHGPAPDIGALFNAETAQRDNIEQLILISFELMFLEGLTMPEGLQEAAQSVKEKSGEYLLDETVTLNNGINLSVKRMHNTLKRYTADLKDTAARSKQHDLKQREAFELHLNLSRLFSPKQKELVLKKYQGEDLTKTEQEYYSRTIKKKLVAVTDKNLVKIANKLIKG